MLRLVLVTLLCLAAATAEQQSTLSDDRRNTRIVGGTVAEIRDYPYQVSVFYLITHICGGSIINAKWVLTAAQCVQQDHSRYAVRAGSSLTGSGGTVFPIYRIIQHEWYNLNTRDFDFALMQVATPFQFGFGIGQIVLPVSMQDTIAGSNATVSGWGTTTENGQYATQLRVAFIPVTSMDYCQTAYPGQITDRMICAGRQAGGLDSCQGDAGGPMVVDNKLIGVISWGQGCGQPDKPGVYGKVSTIRQWIDGHSDATTINPVNLAATFCLTIVLLAKQMMA